jgi:hypothetical protein
MVMERPKPTILVFKSIGLNGLPLQVDDDDDASTMTELLHLTVEDLQLGSWKKI